MLDKIFLQKKMQLLSKYIGDLEPLIFNFSTDEIKNDLKKPAIERYFQQIVDMMIDINTHIIKESNLGSPDDLQSTFVMLGEFKILDSAFATKIAPIVGSRNMIVHRYEKLDLDLFLQNLKNNFSDFKTYMIQVDNYIKKNN